MPNPQTMTEREDQDARDKTFYLVKKYTSYTFLEQARMQYQAFLNAFALQLNDPALVKPEPGDQRWFEANMADGTYEADYRRFLKNMISIEEGIKLLRTTPHKQDAYRSILSSRFTEGLWSRGAVENAVEHDPFYTTLGMRTHTYDSNGESHAARYEANVLQVVFAREGLLAFKKTVASQESSIEASDRWTEHWTYDSLFCGGKNCGLNFNFPPISYPAILHPCPPKNPTPEGQIWSGEEIPTTGIWEPWFAEESLLGGIVSRLAGKQPTTLTGKVGCPNYFLAGATAFEYEMEGTDKKEKVAWRLLWEDTRYLDGTIPEEENEYFAVPATVESPTLTVLTARPGEPCPEAGEWYSVNWDGRKAVLEKGEPMPGPEYGKTGVVIWHLKKEAKR